LSNSFRLRALIASSSARLTTGAICRSAPPWLQVPATCLADAAELSPPLGHSRRLVHDKHHPPHTEIMRRRLTSIEIFWTPGRRDRLAFDRLVLFDVVLAVYPSRD
jgi:hypothetical protein